MLHFFDESHVGIDGGGWAIKVFTILASAFQEVIICDADVVFLQDPEVLFEDPGYNRTGTLFFRDREIFPGDGNVHEWWAGIMEGRKPSEQLMSSRWYTEQASREEMESGVVVINKKRREVALGLVFTGYLNIKAVREPVTYAQTYGPSRFSAAFFGLELTSPPPQATRRASGCLLSSPASPVRLGLFFPRASLTWAASQTTSTDPTPPSSGNSPTPTHDHTLSTRASAANTSFTSTTVSSLPESLLPSLTRLSSRRGSAAMVERLAVPGEASQGPWMVHSHPLGSRDGRLGLRARALVYEGH